MLYNVELNPEWLSFFNIHPIVSERLIQSGYEIYFIDKQKGIIPPYLDQIDYWHELSLLQKAWEIIDSSKHTEQDQLNIIYDVIDSIGEINPDISSPFTYSIRHIRNDPTGLIYFVLVQNSGFFPIYDFDRMLNFARIRKGNFPIHASGIIRQNALYLFGGSSGIGKSTISQLSLEYGAEILDDDQLIIREIGNGTYSANAWGYSLVESSAHLKAVFKLVQNSQDRLIPMTKSQSARFLFTQVMETTGQTNQGVILQKIFSFTAHLARTIPGYELHFRKSPDFWKLIDAEFPPG